MDLKTYLMYETICRGIGRALQAKRESTSRREYTAHLLTIVNHLDLLDHTLGR